MKKTNSRGTSNLEVVLSFVIFMGFLIFLFFAFPLNKAEKSKIGLDAAETGIFNYTGINLTYFSIALKNPDEIKKNNKDCIIFKPDFNPNVLTKIVVKDENDTRLDADSKNEKKIKIKGIKAFYQIYSSEEFEENDVNGDCENLNKENENEFEVGLVRRYSAISAKKLQILNDTYFTEYLNLHIKFSIPKRENFGFIVKDMVGNEIYNAMNKKPEKASVLSREIPIQIVYSNGTFRYAMLNIQTW